MKPRTRAEGHDGEALCPDEQVNEDQPPVLFSGRGNVEGNRPDSSKVIFRSNQNSIDRFPNLGTVGKKSKASRADEAGAMFSRAIQNPIPLTAHRNEENTPSREIKKYPSSPVLQTEKRALAREEREKKIRNETHSPMRGGEAIEYPRQIPTFEGNKNTSPLSKANFMSKGPVKPNFSSTNTVPEMTRTGEKNQRSELAKTTNLSPKQRSDPRPAIWEVGWAAGSQTSPTNPSRSTYLEHEGDKMNKITPRRRLVKKMSKANVASPKAANDAQNDVDDVGERSRGHKGGFS